ncbi:MAG: hypothetical protein K5837_03965 [Candidatus Saccharibacteria bacterium]|nr:hypothetical protein [Candidatus Saccharibacteria bacterium]
MARPKKDGSYVNFYIDRKLVDELRDYAEEKGQTMTMALERILKEYFEQKKEKPNTKDE